MGAIRYSSEFVHCLKRIGSVSIAIVLAVAISVPVSFAQVGSSDIAMAAEPNIIVENCGKCTIKLDQETKVMTIEPTPGESGRLPSAKCTMKEGPARPYEVAGPLYSYTYSQFEKYKDSGVKEVHFNDGVKMPFDISRMFDGWKSLEKVDFGNADFSKVTKMCALFSGCSNLRSLDLSQFYTSKVTDMSDMFFGCSRLESIDLSSFDTSSVTRMDNMFSGCSSITTLDLTRFDTSHILSFIKEDKSTDRWGMRGMFQDCKKLNTIYVASGSSDFNRYKTFSYRNMFSGCISLKGEAGTTYDPANVNSDFARIDSVDAPGYFTGVEVKEIEPPALAPEPVPVPTVVKYQQKIAVKAAKKVQTIRSAKLKKKAYSISKAIIVKGAKGKITYKKLAGKKNVKKFKVNSRTGRITVPKNTKKGIYVLKIRVLVYGNTHYDSASKTVSVKIKVK